MAQFLPPVPATGAPEATETGTSIVSIKTRPSVVRHRQAGRSGQAVDDLQLTARVEEIDRLLGLELGAEDYICKPFSPREVVARVKAVLRRVYAPHTGKTLVAGEVTLIPETHQVLVEDHELKLTPCAFNLLKTMLSHPNRIFSRNALINVVQGYDFEGYERIIDSHIKNLRKKLPVVYQALSSLALSMAWVTN